MNKFKKSLIELMTFITVFNLAGCAKRCDIDKPHAHLYKSDIGIYKYGDCDYVYRANNYEQTGQISEVSPSQVSLINYINKYDFIDIEANRSLIESCFIELDDFIEYEHEYDDIQITKFRNNDGTFTNIETHSLTIGWTRFPEGKNLTGQTRIMSHGYRGYRVFINEMGNYEYELSPYYSSIDELINAGYPYMTFKTFYEKTIKNKIVNTTLSLTKN